MKNWYFKNLQTIAKSEEKLPDFAMKMFKSNFGLWSMSSNPSARLENLHWPVIIVKLRKGKIFRNFENHRKF